MNSDWMRLDYSTWYRDFGMPCVWTDGLASQADSLAMAVSDMLMCGIAHWDIKGKMLSFSRSLIRGTARLYC